MTTRRGMKGLPHVSSRHPEKTRHFFRVKITKHVRHELRELLEYFDKHSGEGHEVAVNVVDGHQTLFCSCGRP